MKNESITLITPTGERPEAFAICETLMRKQTAFLKVSQWIVIDDGRDSIIPTLGQKVIRGPKIWTPDYNTQRDNMNAALPHVKGDIVAVIEDDDYFRADYLEQRLELLKHCKIAGEANLRYYSVNVPGYMEMQNYQHSALSMTVFRKELLPLLHKAVNSGNKYFDVELWRYVREDRIPAAIVSDTGTCVGMKGLPGRANIGVGGRNRGYKYDGNLKKLKEWLEENHKLYLPFINKLKTAAKKS